MRFLAVVVHYLIWHYSRALVEFSHIYKNIILFVYNFFSVPILLRSYFAPWRRMGEAYPKNVLNFSELFSVLLINLIMRSVGMVMRTIMIVAGLLVLAVILVLYPILIISWLLLPLFIIILILLGFGLLFK